ncbi:TonB-dependent receptor [Aurantibacter crassamenti]|uniref:TonB-dependent receptor n=1 Tax=Aurantibacter crassamenti TaxID=1837375 RepID=UPI0019396CB2|nr:TonB-dependent receptor [Aurantibacter crassamenti]MBM1104525.1 TonB-dependent receptor [Aurantibacter crassamenti]
MDRLKSLKSLGVLRITHLILFLVISNLSVAQNSTHELTIKVTEQSTGASLENANIAISPCACGGKTDENGILTIALPEENYTVTITYVGFQPQTEQIILNKDQLLEIYLNEQTEQLSEVVVSAKKVNENIESPQMGVLRLDTKDLKKLPTILGEFDVLKSVTLLAGVNSAGDVSNGISVRGGSLDQNLLLYDYAPIYNPTHLFGLFSVFTPDIISTVDLYRANIPSNYGGRVASVLDIKVKNPYSDTLKLSGGIGLASSRLLLETPIVKDKLMLIAGVRGGFTDFLLPIFSKRLKNTKAKFADATVKLLYLPTENDQVSFTGFYSKDFYQLDLVSEVQNITAESNQYDFNTFNGTLNWIHSFNNKTFLKTVLVGSQYTPKIIFPQIESTNKIEYSSRINTLSFISELTKEVSTDFEYKIGVQANQYKIKPGDLDPGNIPEFRSVSLNSETSYELSGYLNTDWKPTDYLSLSAGLRYNHFLFVGPYNLATFDDTGNNLVSTEFIEKGKTVTSFDAFEPRLGLSLQFSDNTSIKASYARINQYVQNLYNSTTPLPTSRWKTSDPNIKPQTGDTYGLGLYQNFYDNAIELSLEGYYRETKNVLTYKPGADFFLEEFIEKDVVQGQGSAYGAELSFKKPKGKINGWFNYTWSRSFLRSTNATLGDRINNNDWFISDFDRPHVFNSTINFEGHKYNTLSFNFTMQSGRPYTLANGIVKLDEIDVPIFLERNNARLPVYHRLDLSWNVHFSKSKENKRWQNDWTFTVYNVYSRDNPLNIFYTQEPATTGGGSAFIFGNTPLGANRISVMNSPIFSLTYNFTFQ